MECGAESKSKKKIRSLREGKRQELSHHFLPQPLAVFSAYPVPLFLPGPTWVNWHGPSSTRNPSEMHSIKAIWKEKEYSSVSKKISFGHDT